MEGIYPERVDMAKRILDEKQGFALSQSEIDLIPKELQYNILLTNLLSIYNKPAWDTINCFSKNSQLHTQCVMIHLQPQNIMCQYDLEIIKNAVLECDQCHLSQYIEDFDPFYKVILIEVELSEIPAMIVTVDQKKSIFKTMCGEDVQSIKKIPIPAPSGMTISNIQTSGGSDIQQPAQTNILPADFDENFATNFENIHMLIKFDHLEFAKFGDSDHQNLRDNINPIFKDCFDLYATDLTLEETKQYLRSYDMVSYRAAFQISFVSI